MNYVYAITKGSSSIGYVFIWDDIVQNDVIESSYIIRVSSREHEQAFDHYKNFGQRTVIPYEIASKVTVTLPNATPFHYYGFSQSCFSKYRSYIIQQK